MALPTSDRVPSRQVTRNGSRLGKRESSLNKRGFTRGKEGDDMIPQPGMLTDPDEFGPPINRHSSMYQNSGTAVQQWGNPPLQNMIHRIGSPFHDYKKQKGVTTAGNLKPGKVVLPSLPRKAERGKGQEGLNRSPMRTTSCGVIMEMIKEEEPQ